MSLPEQQGSMDVPEMEAAAPKAQDGKDTRASRAIYEMD